MPDEGYPEGRVMATHPERRGNAVKTYTDSDIGKCDDCGSDEGWRVNRFREITMVDGERASVQVWLCAECRYANRL